MAFALFTRVLGCADALFCYWMETKLTALGRRPCMHSASVLAGTNEGKDYEAIRHPCCFPRVSALLLHT